VWAIVAVLLLLGATAVVGMTDPRWRFRLGAALIAGFAIVAMAWFVVAGNVDDVAAIVGSAAWLVVVGVVSGWSGWGRR